MIYSIYLANITKYLLFILVKISTKRTNIDYTYQLYINVYTNCKTVEAERCQIVEDICIGNVDLSVTLHLNSNRNPFCHDGNKTVNARNRRVHQQTNDYSETPQGKRDPGATCNANSKTTC